MAALLGALGSAGAAGIGGAAAGGGLGAMLGNAVIGSVLGDASKDLGGFGSNSPQGLMAQLLPGHGNTSASQSNAPAEPWAYDPSHPGYSFNYQPMGSAQPVGSYGNNANNYQVGSSTSPFAQFLVGSH